MPDLVPSPLVMVIFGVTGDLSHNKLMPALFSLFKQGFLPSRFSIIGFSHRQMSDGELRDTFTGLKADARWEDFAAHVVYQEGAFE